MIGFPTRRNSIQTIGIYLIILSLLTGGISGCSDRIEPPRLSSPQPATEIVSVGTLAEVAPPAVIGQLQQVLEQYQPQISIIAPKPDQIFQDNTVEVNLKVQDLPLFKNPDLEMGPHLHLIVDNAPEQEQDLYTLDQPIRLENLSPGTHTLRVFAVRPWHESFKNEGAYAQTTFSIFTKTDNNNPDPNLPLLTYSRPKGDYGAEPILLDFYLTNAPLHLVAQKNPDDNIPDWRIRVTINEEKFLLDDWQAVYLKGFKEGKNWVKLEFIDEQGNLINNAFNTTVRLINYQPKGKDTLAQLMRGKLTAQEARGIVDPNYQIQPEPVASPTPSPTPSPIEIIPETPTPAEEITVPEEIETEEIAPTEEKTLILEEETPTSEAETSITELAPVVEETPTPEPPKETETNLVPTSEEISPLETLPETQEESVSLETPLTPSSEETPPLTESLPMTETPVETIDLTASDTSSTEETVSTPQSPTSRPTLFNWLKKVWNRIQNFLQFSS